MKTGRVKFFNVTKGYGFIKEDDGSEIFVHSTGLNGNGRLSPDDLVEYEVSENKKGTIAVNVSKLDGLS